MKEGVGKGGGGEVWRPGKDAHSFLMSRGPLLSGFFLFRAGDLNTPRSFQFFLISLNFNYHRESQFTLIIPNVMKLKKRNSLFQTRRTVLLCVVIVISLKN